MKKILLVSALVLVIATSMVSGTLAAYQISLPEMSTGSVVAKKFVLVKGTPDTFDTNVKIAPSEKKEMTFSVMNNEPENASEVNMNVKATITLDDVSSTVKAIVPLTVIVYQGTDTTTVDKKVQATMGTLTSGKGTLTFNFDIPVSTTTAQTFTVVVEWPDPVGTVYAAADYAGPTHGTSLKVSVVGTQN